MRVQIRTAVLSTLLVCVGALPATADVQVPAIDPESIRQLSEMMRHLAAESRRDARRIERAYGRSVHTAALRDRDALEQALDDGSILALPADTARFNVAPRVEGRHPIGEKDLAHQPLYVAARPATLGLLLHVAAQVGPVPLDVTSLVRHRKYQRALQRTNPNARTRVPTHVLGFAFDISVLHATPREAAAIRDVLRRMRDDGLLFFIAERRQLVFHVVPAPGRLAYYDALYRALIAAPAPAIAVRPALPLEVSSPPSPDLALLQATQTAGGVPPALLASALLWALAASGAGASAARRRALRRPAGLSLRS